MSTIISLIIFAVIAVAILHFSALRKRKNGKQISEIEALSAAVTAWLVAEALPWIQGLF